MKLLLDQGLPRGAAAQLRLASIDTVHTGEIGYVTADDRDILLRAQEESRVIVTLDSDFHTLVAWSHTSSPSVIRIRIEGLRAGDLVKLLLLLLPQWTDELNQGTMLTVQPGRVRMHRLPIIPR